jgi:hypothetical protein
MERSELDIDRIAMRHDRSEDTWASSPDAKADHEMGLITTMAVHS